MTILKNDLNEKTKPDSYGYFDDNEREYVITHPKTPYPWVNYLGYRDFLGMITNTGGGYSFYRDAKLRRITRYRYNNIPLDVGGRYFYVKDGDEVWSPGWKPARTPLDHYVCRHGMGYTRIIGARNGVEAEVLFFVPLDCHVEIQHLTLRNKSSRQKTFKLFSFTEWCLWNAEDDMSNFQRNFSTGEVEVKGSTIYHKTEYRERRNHFAFYGVNQPIQGFDTDRASFLGDECGLENPEAVACGMSGDSMAFGWSPIASHSLEVTLAPGEEKDFIFTLGYVENEESQKWNEDGTMNTEKAEEVMARFASTVEVHKAYMALKKHWSDLLAQYTLDCEDEKLNRQINIWNQYQCVVTFNLSRSASLFESGVSRGIGFRDSNQDLLGATHIMPERARQRLLDLASTQFSDGSAYHQYQPLTKKGNAAIGGGFNDDPLWLILAAAAYMKETGDLAILDETTPFDDGNPDAVFFDHLQASFNHVVENRGPHGLPLIGRADWNDCLNLNCFSTNPDESFQTTTIESSGVAESLMIAGLFVLTGGDYAEICRRTGREDEALRAEKHVAEMVAAVKQHGWDGRWFLRAYRHDGQKVGSSENREGQIFIEPQGWCVMAGIGVEDGLAERALDSVEAFLDCDHGVVLLYPAYSRYDKALGEISSYPKGYKENGSVFCHTNPWIVIAETMLGRGDRAYNYFCKTAPPYREDMAELHKTEPYIYAQMIAGKEAMKPGEAKNSWLTGTAAWSFYAAANYLLGVRPEHDGLRIDPCIPQSWKGFRVTRKFRGATYHIEVKNPGHVSKGVKSMLLDGQPIEGNVAPIMEPGGVHAVTVIMGR